MIIELTGLIGHGRHGVLEIERGGQPFVADITLRLPPPVDDRLRCTVDYSAVAAAVTDMIEGEPVALIETLAAGIADELLSRWPLLTSVGVTIHKPQAPIDVPVADVSCRLKVKRRRPPDPFVLSLGANLGDATATLRAAVGELSAIPGVAVTAVSGIYRSTPQEVDEPQPDYLNLVAAGVTTLDPTTLLSRTMDTENRFGRQRSHRHAPRTLDIDIVKYGDVVSDDPVLTLPHPRANQRAFVLVPWLSIDPDASLPSGLVAELASRLNQDIVLVSQFD